MRSWSSPGDVELTEKKLIPGRDYSKEIARIGEQIGHLSSVVAIGRATGKDVGREAEALEQAQAEIQRLAATVSAVSSALGTSSPGSRSRWAWAGRIAVAWDYSSSRPRRRSRRSWR
jgi:hypothetical protein